MAQVCAQCLDLSLDKIHISETNIDKVPNAGPTGGSVSNDIYGMAIKVYSCINDSTVYNYMHYRMLVNR